MKKKMSQFEEWVFVLFFSFNAVSVEHYLVVNIPLVMFSIFHVKVKFNRADINIKPVINLNVAFVDYGFS